MVLVADGVQYAANLGTLLRTVDAAARRATGEENSELILTFLDVLGSLRPSGVVRNANEIAARAIADANRLGGRHDLLAPSGLYAQLVAVGCADRNDQLRLVELTRTDVPCLDELSLHDIVRIRQASDTLDRWRHHLSIALERPANCA
ncbi:hypothetical protein [Flindersiella endophytica]